MKTGVITPKDIRQGMRFDSSFHLADAQIYEKLICSHNWTPLNALSSSIFTSGRNKRVYTSPERGYPFLSNSDVVASNPLATCKYDSIKFNNDASGFLKEGMILTGRVGAIGQTAYVTSWIEKHKAIGSDNIIRIVCKPNVPNGYVYAFLTSKIGNLMFWKHAAGGVQPYITDKMVASLPIPVFPTELQNEIDGLIRSAASLRDQANELLAECVADIEKALSPEITNRKTGTVSIKDIKASHNRRFEANYHISSGAEVDKYIRENFEWKPLSDCCEKIFRPGIFKRQYVKSGVMFLGGADILNAIPSSDKFLGKSQIANMPELLVNENWLLVTCGGTIGNCVMVNRPLSKCAISQHVMRIVPNTFPIGYVFAFLQSKYGQALIQKNPFGAVIPQMEPEHFKRLAIPLLSNPLIESINNRIMEYKECFSIATEYERKAISMVEAEIESWNHKPTKK